MTEEAVKPKSYAKTHTVLCADGNYRKFKLTRTRAIAVHCTECLGFEEHPRDCTSLHCPLFPWRKKTLATMRGDIHPNELNRQ